MRHAGPYLGIGFWLKISHWWAIPDAIMQGTSQGGHFQTKGAYYFFFKSCMFFAYILKYSDP